MCDKSYSQEATLYTHYTNAHHYTRFPCSECQKTYVTQRDLNIHFENCHKHYKYMCPEPECSKKFCSLQGYRGHYESIHLQLIHICDFCDKSYKSEGSKHVHMTRKHRGYEYACYCGKTYSSSAALRRHKRLKNHI